MSYLDVVQAMDSDRLFDLFAYGVLLALFTALIVKLRTLHRFLRVFSYCFVLLLGALFVSEAATRLYYAVKNDENGFLYYPFRVYTSDYFILDWLSPYTDGRKDQLSANTLWVKRSLKGLHYFKVVENYRGFRYDASHVVDGPLDIIAFGGSTTWGTNSRGITFVDHLQANLSKKSARVFNLGKPAQESSMFLKNWRYSDLASLVDPELAIMYMGHNDSGEHHYIHQGIYRVSEYFARLAEEYKIIKYSLLARNLSIYLNSARINSTILDRLSEPYKNFDPARVQASTDRFVRNVEGVMAELLNLNPQIKFLVIPEFTNYVYPISDFETGRRTVNLKAPKAYDVINYEFLQKREAMKAMSTRSDKVFYMDHLFFDKYQGYELFTDGVHLTDFGGKVLADEIVKKLTEEKLISQ